MTEPILEQEHIDQLIAAIDQGKVPTQPDALLSARGVLNDVVERYVEERSGS